MNEFKFTIDTKSHLRKISEFTYSEKEYYLVELIRESIKRNSTNIEISLNEKSVLIKDNGIGIDNELLNKIIKLHSSSDSFEKKEEFIESITNGFHLGLLALFSLNPKKIIIYNKFGSNSTKHELEEKRVKKEIIKLENKGTKIQLFRNVESIKEEKKILVKYLKNVDKKSKLTISLNGEKIKFQGNISNCIITDSFYLKNLNNVLIGIPEKENVCKITLTYFGIPWLFEMYYPIEGYVFDVTIETNVQLTHIDYSKLLEKVQKLYDFLAKNYGKLPVSHKERLKELVAVYSTRKKDFEKFSNMEIYKTAGGEFLSLSKIKELSEYGPIQVIDKLFKQKENSNLEENTLLLNSKDIDFLKNQVKLELNIINNLESNNNNLNEFFQKIQKVKILLINFFDKLLSRPIKHQLTKEQHLFKTQIKELFGKKYEKINFTNQVGFNYYHIETINKKQILNIHLNHKVVKRLMQLMANNSNYGVFAKHMFFEE